MAAKCTITSHAGTNHLLDESSKNYFEKSTFQTLREKSQSIVQMFAYNLLVLVIPILAYFNY
jgi:hypothetical protein